MPLRHHSDGDRVACAGLRYEMGEKCGVRERNRLLEETAETALAAACQMRRREMIEYLLSQGAEMDIYAACVLGRADAVTAFLDADPTVVNAKAGHVHGKPPLYFAAEQPEVEALLKGRGAG